MKSQHRMTDYRHPRGGAITLGLIAAGVALPAVQLEAQTRSQTPARAGPMHLSTPADTALIPSPLVAPAPAFGLPQPGRAAFPEPIRPGRAPLRLPPSPGVPVVVDPVLPPVFVVPTRPRRAREHFVIIQPHPHYTYPPAVVPSPPSTLVAPATVEPVQPRPLTGRELGDALLHWDEPERAIAVYQEHLAENPSDHEALRMLGFALIDAGRVQKGVAAVGLAYERDQGLAHSAVPADAFGPPEDMRRNLNRVSMYANRVNTASAWLALTVLMQAEGRMRPAAAMLDRAEQTGLSEEVARQMRSVVGARQVRSTR